MHFKDSFNTFVDCDDDVTICQSMIIVMMNQFALVAKLSKSKRPNAVLCV
uniref:Uncharacterized protein n=1 Tax=Arion vulgaris TaxID=1028688 RepID=A0A0B7AXV1_9EUPU